MPEANEINGKSQLPINSCYRKKYNQLIEIMEVFNELGREWEEKPKKEIRPPQEVEQADGSQKGVEC